MNTMNNLKLQTKISEDTPKIYVACLSAYNNGFLHGCWIDVSEGIEHVTECIKEILFSSPVAEECEEWAIHDYQGFGNYNISESHNLEDVCSVAEFICECNDFPPKVISSLIEDYGIEGAKEKMENEYIGEFDSESDFAYHYVEETGLISEIPQSIAMYFDYEAYGKDLSINGDVFEIDGYYFWNT